MFKQLFQSWRDNEQTQGFGTTYTVGKIGNLHNKHQQQSFCLSLWSSAAKQTAAWLHHLLFLKHSCLILNTLGLQTAKVDQLKFDVMQLHARPELAAQQRMVDDASGDVKVKHGTTVHPANTCQYLRWERKYG